MKKKAEQSASELKTVTAADGSVHIFDRNFKSLGVLKGEDGKPITAPKDVSQATLKAVDNNLEQIKALSIELRDHMNTDAQRESIRREIRALAKKNELLLGVKPAEAATPGPIPSFKDFQSQRKAPIETPGSVLPGGAIGATGLIQ
jgi:hypothetical protein